MYGRCSNLLNICSGVPAKHLQHWQCEQQCRCLHCVWRNMRSCAVADQKAPAAAGNKQRVASEHCRAGTFVLTVLTEVANVPLRVTAALAVMPDLSATSSRKLQASRWHTEHDTRAGAHYGVCMQRMLMSPSCRTSPSLTARVQAGTASSTPPTTCRPRISWLMPTLPPA